LCKRNDTMLKPKNAQHPVSIHPAMVIMSAAHNQFCELSEFKRLRRSDSIEYCEAGSTTKFMVPSFLPQLRGN
jgi:hypothetical protein